MPAKKALLLGISSGLVSATGATVYTAIFFDELFDFSKDLSYTSIASTCIFACVAAGFVYWAAIGFLKTWGDRIFNIVFCLGSIACVRLPMEASIMSDHSEFYPVFAIPLYFFPVLAWMSLRGFFFKTQLD